MTRLRIGTGALLVLATMATQLPAATLTAFSDRALFESNLRPGFQVEDFEDNLGPNTPAVIGFPEPLNQFSNNAAFQPGDIEPGLNLFVAGGGSGMVLLTEGFLGGPSDVVGPNTFSDDLVVQLPAKGPALGFDFLDLNAGPAGRQATLQVFHNGGTLLGNFDVMISSTPQFFGAISYDLPIGAIVFRDPIAPVGELVDNVTFGQPIPEPTSMALFGMTALGFGVGFRRRRNGEAVEEVA